MDLMKLFGKIALIPETDKTTPAVATVAFVEKFEDIRVCVDGCGRAPLTWNLVGVKDGADFVLRVVENPFDADIRVRFLAHPQGSAEKPCCRG